MQSKVFRYLSTSVVLASTVMSTALFTGTASAATIKPFGITRAKHSISGQAKIKPAAINFGAEGTNREEGSENIGQQNAEGKGMIARIGTGISGTVAAINGTSFTITTHGRSKAATSSITYTINTDSTTAITKAGVSATISDIAIGQRILAIGTIDKTALSVAATKININANTTVKPMVKIGAKNKMHTKKGIAKIKK